MVNTSKVNATSYHLGCDGLVECFNHTLTTILSMYVSEHQTDWDHFIPYALFAYRTSVQSSTRETPFLYGRDPRLPSDASLLKAQETLPLLITSAGQKSFSYRGARLWNSLSREAKVATSLNAFKRLSKNDVDALSQS